MSAAHCQPINIFYVDCDFSKGGCGESCVNRQLSTECPVGYCRGGAFKPCSNADHEQPQRSPRTRRDRYAGDGLHLPCANTVIQRRQYPPVEIFDTKSSRGFGLRCLVDAERGTVLGEYKGKIPIVLLYACADSGEVITAEELSKRRAERDPTAAFYFASLGEGLFIDAERRGSYARFANHSCDPNCALEKWTVGQEPRLVLVATRDIPKLMELCYNYNAGGGVADITHAQRCRCGAEHCSGTIGARRKAPIFSEIDVTKDDSGSAKRRKAKSAGKQAAAGSGSKRSRAPAVPEKTARAVPTKRLRGNLDGPMSE